MLKLKAKTIFLKSKNIFEQKIKNKIKKIRLHAFDQIIQKFKIININNFQNFTTF